MPRKKAQTLDLKGHDALVEVIVSAGFEMIPSPKLTYARVMRGGKLAGWFTVGKKHIRVRIGGGPKDAHNVATVAQAKAVVKKLDAQVAS